MICYIYEDIYLSKVAEPNTLSANQLMKLSLQTAE